MAAEIEAEPPERGAVLRAELRAGGRPGYAAGHRAAAAEARRGCSAGLPEDGFIRAGPGCTALLGAFKALCNRLNPAVVYLDSLEV